MFVAPLMDAAGELRYQRAEAAKKQQRREKVAELGDVIDSPTTGGAEIVDPDEAWHRAVVALEHGDDAEHRRLMALHEDLERKQS